MNDNDIYSVDFMRSLPLPLKNDPDMMALAQVVADQLRLNASEIKKNIIYARIDELDEATLDILAFDLHVDWYDYTYPIELKRQTLRDSVNIHRHLGTKYAVETALRTVFPISNAEEWFNYGGDPYYFRLAIEVPPDGMSLDKQQRAIEKVRFYKNLRSHLESVHFRTESHGTVRTGAFATTGLTIDIFPELTTQLELTGKNRTASMTTTRQTLEVLPELSKRIEITGRAGADALTATRQSVEIYPEQAARVEITAQAGTSGAIAAQQSIEIFPDIPGNKEEAQ